jgi:hypothetical protein
LSKQVVKVVGDPDTNVIEFHPDNPASENLAGYLNDVLDYYQGELKKSRAKKSGAVKQADASQAEAERYEKLAKSVSDRELARYYAERAKELRSSVQPVNTAKDASPKPVTPKPVSPTPAARSAGANFNQAVKPTSDKLTNETARQGLLVNAESCERESVEWNRKAQEKQNAVLRAPRELVSYYNEQARSYRANAEMARSRGESFRRAAASL